LEMLAALRAATFAPPGVVCRQRLFALRTAIADHGDSRGDRVAANVSATAAACQGKEAVTSLLFFVLLRRLFGGDRRVVHVLEDV